MMISSVSYIFLLPVSLAHAVVKIQYCGVCASDLHTASSGWGDMSAMYPQVVGHEIVGEVLRVGDKVDKNIKVGDIVGVGAQCDSCQDCEYCDKGESLSVMYDVGG
jgi:D-arabinose 1-dehydrogenase-like Zn-dependent alcohol dehydrogenase